MWTLLIWLLLALPSAGTAQHDEERALERVRQRIEAIEQRIASDTTRRSDQAAELKRLELDIAATQTELERLRARAAEQTARRAELERQRREAMARLDGERAALAEQVRLSYMTGREELFKLLLSQESPADLGRMIVYYDYLNKARSARIESVSERVRTLDELAQQTTAVERELAALQSAQEQQLAGLERGRRERQRLVAELDRAIASSGQEIANLREEEQRLADLLIELGELLAAFPVGSEDPFVSLKGRLAWPAPGRLVGDFGEPRGGGGAIRWNGVLLEAERGTTVRAVYHGRVAFSDWLPGLGLLVIVDHGDGYMSLYGHNEVLLKESGDWVTPGEPVGRVGDTGGRAAPSLYFEIRHHGEPENPHRWIGAELAAN